LASTEGGGTIIRTFSVFSGLRGRHQGRHPGFRRE
jgi:hypothetical protein